MVILGLLLIAAGGAGILAGLFTAELGTNGHVQLLGVDVAPRTLFLAGVVAGLLVLCGYAVLKFGTKRELRRRRDRKRLAKLSQQLETVEGDRHDDGSRDEGSRGDATTP